ncbi:MAG: hypothetical protein ACTSQ7_05750 [Alphaproteobacteria bacterium]
MILKGRARGNPVVGGLGILPFQVRLGFDAWSGGALEVIAELRAFVLAE